MLIPILVITKLFILFEIINLTTSLRVNDEHEKLEMLFRARSETDWHNVWHTENHSRCREKLIRHLYWACEKDIYKLTRRNNDMSYNSDVEKRNYNIWLTKNDANQFLRTRRHMKKNGSTGITSECCYKSCNWEEYAEYCPSNKRKNHIKN